MKKSFLIILVVLCFFTSCATSGMIDSVSEPVNNQISNEKFSLSIHADVKGNNYPYLSLLLNNKTNSVILVNLNNSVISGGAISYRVVSGETRNNMSNLAQVNIPVAPISSSMVSLYNPDTIESGKKIISKGFSFGKGASLTLCLNIDGKDEYITIPLFGNASTDLSNQDVVGTINFDYTSWHFLFLGDPKESIMEKAQKEAVKRYGEGVRAANIYCESSWNPASLLFDFDMLGWVENIKVIADVIRE